MVLHVFHASLEDKEFEFTIDIDATAPDGFNTAVAAALEECSATMLEQVQPVKCCSCGKENAVRLVHHPMLFDQVVPPRVEDMPQPVCSSSECFRAAGDEMKSLLKRAVPGLQESPVCANCHLAKNNVTLMQCSRCKSAKYCDATCQRMHWPIHKNVCQPPAAVAAPAASGSA